MASGVRPWVILNYPLPNTCPHYFHSFGGGHDVGERRGGSQHHACTIYRKHKFSPASGSAFKMTSGVWPWVILNYPLPNTCPHYFHSFGGGHDVGERRGGSQHHACTIYRKHEFSPASGSAFKMASDVRPWVILDYPLPNMYPH